MSDPVSISKHHLPHKAMDYEALRKEGIGYLQKFSGGIWTDYNHHDPGVTILEYLCFGITDLAYRCNFHVKDLLYSSEYNRTDRPSNAFFPPDEILSCAPLTVTDLKCLLLDHFKDVLDDAWIDPVADRYGIRGLYDFRLRLKDSIQEEEAQYIIEKVRRLYLDNRALGEDIGKVTVLSKRKLSVKALIEIAPEVSPTQVLSAMLRNLERCLTPVVQIRSLEELRSSGITSDSLFDGPKPLNGFVACENFSSSADTIHLSSLRDAISETEGVIGIRDLVFMVDDIVVFSEEVMLDENTCLTLSPLGELPGSHQIRFVRNDQEVVAELNVAKQMWQAAVARDDQQLQSKKYRSDDLPTSQKRLEDIAAYYSIQQLFPVVYGITSFGIPGNPTAERYAYARQLKGYLAIFEILLASSMKQITRLKYLFHVDPPSSESRSSDQDTTFYASRFPFDIPDIDPLLRLGTEESKREETEKALNDMAALSDRPFERRIQFLSHLLSRFGESIESDFVKKIAEWKNEDADQLAVRMYTRMLSTYVPSGGKRGTGLNYLERYEEYQSDNRFLPGVPPLKTRICILLNIAEKADVSCTDFFPFDRFDPPSPERKGGGIPVKSLLRHGGGAEGYEIVRESGEWTLYLVANAGEEKYQLGTAENQESLQRLRDEFIADVLRFDERSTNFFIVEHVLLRPLSPSMARLTFQAPMNDRYIPMCSPHYHPPAVIEGWSQSLLAIAANPDNFSIKQESEDSLLYFIVISAGEDEILVSNESFPEDVARTAISEISRNMTRIIEQNPGEINTMFGPPDWKTDNIIVGDADGFYSARLSVVIPDWPSRFAGPDRRRVFERLVLQFAPAHLHIDFLWLNWSQMGRFEDAYFSWRLAKATPGTATSVIDVFSYILADFLDKAAGNNKV